MTVNTKNPAHSFNIAGLGFVLSSTSHLLPSTFVQFLLAMHLTFTGEPMYAAIVFVAPQISQIIVQPLLAKALQAIPVSRQFRSLIAIRLLSMTLTVGVLYWFDKNLSLSVACYALLTIAHNLDSIISAHASRIANVKYKLDFGRSSAATNILGRGSIALAAYLAPMLLGDYRSVLYFVPAIYLLGLPAAFVAYEIEKKSEDGATQSPESWVPWATWYIVFLFCANLALGCVTFSLVGIRPTHVSALYTAFLVVQLLVAGNVISVRGFAQRTTVCMFAATLFVSLGVYSILGESSIGLALIAFIGIVYAFVLPSLSQLVLEKLTRVRFVEYVAISRSAARIASITSTSLAGFAIAGGYPVPTILFVSAISGLALTFFLFIWTPRAVISQR